LFVVIVVVVVVVVADVVEGQEILSRPRPEKRAVPASLGSQVRAWKGGTAL